MEVGRSNHPGGSEMGGTGFRAETDNPGFRNGLHATTLHTRHQLCTQITPDHATHNRPRPRREAEAGCGGHDLGGGRQRGRGHPPRRLPPSTRRRHRCAARIEPRQVTPPSPDHARSRHHPSHQLSRQITLTIAPRPRAARPPAPRGRNRPPALPPLPPQAHPGGSSLRAVNLGYNSATAQGVEVSLVPMILCMTYDPPSPAPARWTRRSGRAPWTIGGPPPHQRARAAPPGPGKGGRCQIRDARNQGPQRHASQHSSVIRGHGRGRQGEPCSPPCKSVVIEGSH
jgi:hypothetical protein